MKDFAVVCLERLHSTSIHPARGKEKVKFLLPIRVFCIPLGIFFFLLFVYFCGFFLFCPLAQQEAERARFLVEKVSSWTRQII